MRYLQLTAILLFVLASCVSAESLFVHNFNDIDSEALEQRLTADYAKGNPLPIEIRQVQGRPDVVTDQVKFGSGALTRSGGANPGRDLLTFAAKDNINLSKGSVEA